MTTPTPRVDTLTPRSTPAEYARVLDDLWAAHTAPREPDAPTVISTFAGCGGSSLGYSAAGYREVLAVEWDDHAVATFRSNFPDVPVWHGDIADLTVDHVLETTGLAPGELTVFDGSPPCQGFSIAGKRQVHDSRNRLFEQYVRLVDGLQPRALVMENVTGLVAGPMRAVFKEICGELRGVGYRLAVRTLDASYYGVPQMRRRVIFIGTRADLNINPTHPEAVTHAIPMRAALPTLARGATPDPTGGDPEPPPLLGGKLGRAWGVIPHGGSVQTLTGGSGYSSTRRTDPNRPCPTLTKMQRSGGFGALCHPHERRMLSITEGKLLSSFPHQFQFPGGDYYDQWSRIGNAVPPLLMYAVARHTRALVTR